jgi:molybdate transport system permease protein
MTEAAWVSLKVLAIDLPLLFLLGTGAGWLLGRHSFRGRELVILLLLLPVALPPSVVGLYILLLAEKVVWIQRLGILFSFPGAVLAPLIPAFPLMMQAALSAFEGVPSSLEDAARMLGHSPWRVFYKVTFPLVWRQLTAGLALAGVRCLGDFGTTLMVAGNIPGKTQTLPLYIYGEVEALNLGGAHAAALLLTFFGMASLFFVRGMRRGGSYVS